VNKTEVVTLCGSVRFAAEHLAAHRRLPLEGCVVLLPALPVADQRVPLLPADLLGPSTSSEIAYAETNGKRVTYEHGNT